MVDSRFRTGYASLVGGWRRHGLKETTMNAVTIRYQVISNRRSGTLATKEKTFKTHEAMEKWVARQEALAEEERSGFVGVSAYSYDQR
jgi:hypothetical protein